MKKTETYQPKHHVRIVTAASLFDGHDAAINVMRRIIQSTGAEVIHLGHDRSVAEVVDCAIQEDVQGIAMTSYQGGHLEYFKYMYDLLKEKGAGHIKIFGGGGGVILPKEIKELHDYGISRIYSPDDGREMGLQGMINDLVKKSDFPIGQSLNGEVGNVDKKDKSTIARVITAAENFPEECQDELKAIEKKAESVEVPILGITGTGGSGKSSVVDELIRRFLNDFEDKTIGVISVYPSKRKTGGALLGDRIRMNAINSERVYMRSLATRQSNLALSKHVKHALNVLRSAQFDLIILETSGIGQSDTEIVDHSDASLYVMTPEYGAATQLEKIDMLDFADDTQKQYKRNHQLFDKELDELPIYGTIASQFNDPGMNTLYKVLIDVLNDRSKKELGSNFEIADKESEKIYIIPPEKVRYLAEIAENNRRYDKWVEEQSKIAQELFSLNKSIEQLENSDLENKEDALKPLRKKYEELEEKIDPSNKKIIEQWGEKVNRYKEPEYKFKVRDKEISIKTHYESLSGTQVPKVALPKYEGWGDLLKWNLQENVPGEFPYTAGVFPFKREGEDPTRMFAGEGSPERTNKRFHYVSYGMPAARLSTAFDSVTLYGRDPDHRPDIYGKVGNSGVSICCLDDAKKLYSGFDLANPKTSVSMTINGPASTIASFFMNAAIDQQCELYIKEHGLEDKVEEKLKELYDDRGIERPQYNADLPEGNGGLGLMLLGVTGDQILPRETYEKIKADTLPKVRGTVQADILKEDQAQNTCIFSTEFSLRLMGDTQEYFINNNIRNFYSVSISGYHIAEAGANPITQLAFTLANGFTYVEYYLSRGMDINKFAPNLSFFFSNGVDPEYAVIGRVARRIWSKAMKYRYNANERSQKLKYHIQTSGRSLHAQEIDFNDIRTTLQALYAIYDNCNSLHTNAFDEAITTPTEDSVRRAIAIQMIINHELGMAKNQNPNQGSFIIEELTDLVEEAVLHEFERITERGGVLGAMENMYQRNKIQEESMYYEKLKHTGDLKIVGVNTFKNSEGSPTTTPGEVIRSSKEEKEDQVETVKNIQKTYENFREEQLEKLKQAAVRNENMFEVLMEASKYSTLGQITETLFEVGGQYRRNM
ncbi:MAG: methylmalonyl-CoA mutase family protein [Flavobacteriales bacterium]